MGMYGGVDEPVDVDVVVCDQLAGYDRFSERTWLVKAGIECYLLHHGLFILVPFLEGKTDYREDQNVLEDKGCSFARLYDIVGVC